MAQAFENDDNMLPKFKRVDVFHKAVLTLVIVIISLGQLIQNFDFNICVVHIKFFVFAQLGSHNSLIRVFIIEALNDLTKRSLVNDSDNFIPVGYMLPYLG